MRSLLALLLALHLPAAGAGTALELSVTGAIGPATRDYVVRSLRQAAEQGAHLVLLRLDTPGGLDSSMRDIVQAVLAAPVPVVGWVAPSGARAASAGTYILYATHVAAMAPATNLGAATPVTIGGLPEPGGEPDDPSPPPPDAKTRKLVNDAAAYLRGLAELRGRNAEWAEQAVREGASLEATRALELGVVDLLAKDRDELLRRLDGRTVNAAGRDLTLATAGLTVTPLEPDWRSRLLAVITDPNVAYLLLLLGIYGLIFEFTNPGALLPGVAGAISLLLALYAFQVLPIDYTGLGLILLGIALMVGEAFAPSFGVLGLGGVVALVIGSLILMDRDVPGFQISLALIAAIAVFSLLFLAALVGMLVRSRGQPVVSGAEEMVGAPAEALEDFAQEGLVRAHGELWRAVSTTPVRKGERLRIVGLEGLCLKVLPQHKTEELNNDQ